MPSLTESAKSFVNVALSVRSRLSGLGHLVPKEARELFQELSDAGASLELRIEKLERLAAADPSTPTKGTVL